jgi:hypothetical protein
MANSNCFTNFQFTESLTERILKDGSGVRQKHNCLGFVFIAAILTTCFGLAWASSVHNVDVIARNKTSPKLA